MPAGEIISAIRESLPSSYTMRVEAFQALLDAKITKYESGPFVVDGVTWRLNLYPSGNTEAGFIALTLEAIQTAQLPRNWKRNVSLKFFVLDQNENKYRVFLEKDGEITKFHSAQKEVGFNKLIASEIFKDPTNGYLIKDSCSFGVEVSVIEYTGAGEHVTIEPTPNTLYSMEVPEFNKLKKDNHQHVSAAFELGGQTWTITIYPGGYNADKFKNVSMFLNLAHSTSNAVLKPGRKLYVDYVLRMVNQDNDADNIEKGGYFWFSESNPNSGFSSFAPITEISPRGKGFLLNDNLTIEVEFKRMTVFQYFP